MDFQAATDTLLEHGVSLRELADELGSSHGALKQARLDPDSAGYRRPPEGWQEGVRELARRRGGKLCELADEFSD